MRMRISMDALRLCALVVAGVTSGYLWRASFESTAPSEQIAATPPIQEAPAPTVVRVPRGQPVVPRRTVRRPVVVRIRQVPQAHAVVISSPVSRPTASGSSPRPPKPSPPKPTPPSPTPTPPTPTPTPTPTPPPPPQTTVSPAATAPQGATAPPQTSTTPGEGDRPGWGNGDKNHDHTGPGKKGP